MAKYKNTVVTKRGIALLQKAQYGSFPLKFTKVETGSGAYSATDDLKDAEALRNKKQEHPVLSATLVSDEAAKVTTVVSNTGLQESYRITEIGLFAEDPDDGDILYSITVSEDDGADLFPAYDGKYPVAINLDIYVAVSGDPEITVYDKNSAYASAKDLRDFIASEITADTVQEYYDAQQDPDPAHEQGYLGHKGLVKLILLVKNSLKAAADAVAKKFDDLHMIASSGSWNDLEDTPTTLIGYGITDAAEKKHGHDAADVTTGVFDMDRIPKGVIPNMVTVKDDASRFALTTDQVKKGDTVKVEETGMMYYVVDTENLDKEAGYEGYTAGAASSVPWEGVTDKPKVFYTHPAYTQRNSGLYKITVDATGHVQEVAAVTKQDIVDLGIPEQDTNTTYKDATQSVAGLMSTTDKKKLDGISDGANKYTHPEYTAQASGLYKITVDETGHVKEVSAVMKQDIVDLGIPGQDTNTTYKEATQSVAGLMSIMDKKKLDGIDEKANKYTHPAYTERNSGLYKITVDATGHVKEVSKVTKQDIVDLGIPGQDTTYKTMTGASASVAGTSGLVPLPAKGKQNAYLKGDGTWADTRETGNDTVAFTSGDNTNLTEWTDVAVLASGEKHSSILNKISTMFRNLRYIWKLMGTADISSIGDGTVRGALSALNTNIGTVYNVSLQGTFGTSATYITGSLSLPAGTYIIVAKLSLQIVPTNIAYLSIICTTNGVEDDTNIGQNNTVTAIKKFTGTTSVRISVSTISGSVTLTPDYRFNYLAAIRIK